MENIRLLDLGNGILWDEWIAYLASLTSIKRENLTDMGRFNSCLDICLNAEVPADEIEVNPLKEQETLKKLLENGYNIIENKVDGNLVLARNRKLTIYEIVERLRIEIKPYRILWVQAFTLERERVNLVVENALELAEMIN